MIVQNRAKNCRACGNVFLPFRTTQKVCGHACAEAFGKAKSVKDAARIERKAAAATRSAVKARLVELQPKKWWKALAKKYLHALVRLEWEGKPCISCGVILRKLGRAGGDYDAGHFRSVGSAPHLEMEKRNIAGQCKQCNRYKEGMHAAFRDGLIALFGVAYVEELEADNTARHLEIDDYKQIIETSKAATKALLAQRELNQEAA